MPASIAWGDAESLLNPAEAPIHEAFVIPLFDQRGLRV
jgi:hypothetical protein